MKNELKNGCTCTHFYLIRILLQSMLMTVQGNNDRYVLIIHYFHILSLSDDLSVIIFMLHINLSRINLMIRISMLKNNIRKKEFQNLN